MDPIEHIEFLSRSQHRVAILRILCRSGPTTQREFRDQLSASRSTVTRALSALEERGWIVPNSGTYQLTAAGREVTEAFLDLRESVALTDDLSPVVDWLPAAGIDFDIERLSDASITESTDSDPYAPVRKHMGGFKEAQSVRAVIPSVDVEAARTFRDQLDDPEFSGTLVVTEDIADRFGQPEYESVTTDLLKAENFTFWVYSDDIHFYFGLLDDTVQIGVEDDQGYPRALLETDDEVVHEWAEAEFERYRSAASPIDDFVSV